MEYSANIQMTLYCESPGKVKSAVAEYFTSLLPELSQGVLMCCYQGVSETTA
jgi:hypothetical protein